VVDARAGNRASVGGKNVCLNADQDDLKNR